MNYQELESIAHQIRSEIIYANFMATSATHSSPALSCTELLTVLYFKILNIDPQNPRWENRDRFILSKGHAYLAYYAILAKRGFFPMEELPSVRSINSILQGHPDMNKTPGVDMTTGSLGNGLSIGAGMALYAKSKQRAFKVYVMIGDGESQEGAIWEAALTSSALKLDNLICIIDYNHYQSNGIVDDIVPMHSMDEKWRAFGWDVLIVNGHEMNEIYSALEIARNSKGRPTIIIANTVKGKGVSFMTHNNEWHAKQLTQSEYEIAAKELEEARHADRI